MHIKELVPMVTGLAVKAGGFLRRRKRSWSRRCCSVRF